MRKVSDRAYGKIEAALTSLTTVPEEKRAEVLLFMAELMMGQFDRMDKYIGERSDSWHESERGMCFHDWSEDWYAVAEQCKVFASADLSGAGFEKVARHNGCLEMDIPGLGLLALPDQEFPFD